MFAGRQTKAGGTGSKTINIYPRQAGRHKPYGDRTKNAGQGTA